jgi:N-acetylglucosamine malate deacetylase 1
MAKNILCIAPHPDDETLGCGGTLLKHKEEGDNIYWLIVTGISEEKGFSLSQIQHEQCIIKSVANAYNFSGVYQLGFPTMHLDTFPLVKIVNAIGEIVRSTAANIIYLPFRNDAHSDHAVVFDAGAACTKSFRYPNVNSILAYETLSETEFDIKPYGHGFRPNIFVDISNQLEQKIKIMKIFDSEMGEFPFPRSEICLNAQAQLRGSQVGRNAAESFMMLRELR